MAILLDEFSGAPVKAWFDTGHHLVRVNHGWTRGRLPFPADSIAGMHLNDVESLNDDHLAPGEGKVDFSTLGDAARKIRHLVFEPSGDVSEESLKRALTLIRKKWK
jgi:sugar phosphate isomerase/epimerase